MNLKSPHSEYAPRSHMHPDLKDRVTRVIYFTLNIREELQSSPQDVDAKECRDNLLGLLDAVEAAGSPRETNQSVQYALAAWIDDLISRTAWTYARAWDAFPLETVLYGTNCRRWRFFELAEEAQAAGDWDALLVFQFCVNFGFRGIYAKERVRIRVRDRLPMLRTRQFGASPSPALSRAVPKRDQSAALAARPPAERRRHGPLLPATLSDWCQKTFSALKGHSGLTDVALPGSMFHRVFPVKRMIADWAIVMAIGVLLSAVLLAIGH